MTATTTESKGQLLKEWISTHSLFALGNTEVAILKPLGTEALNNIGGCRALKYSTKKLAQKNLSVILQEILQAVKPLYWWSPEGFRNNPVLWLTLQTQPLNFITWWNRAVLIGVERTRNHKRGRQNVKSVKDINGFLSTIVDQDAKKAPHLTGLKDTAIQDKLKTTKRSYVWALGPSPQQAPSWHLN